MNQDEREWKAPRTYSVRRVAVMLDTTPKAIYERLRRNPTSLPLAVRPGGWRIRFVCVEEWLETLARESRRFPEHEQLVGKLKQLRQANGTQPVSPPEDHALQLARAHRGLRVKLLEAGRLRILAQHTAAPLAGGAGGGRRRGVEVENEHHRKRPHHIEARHRLKNGEAGE